MVIPVNSILSLKHYLKSQMKGKCKKCKIPAEMACARCGMVHYCSRNCQVQDWPTHKQVCVSPAVRRESWVLTLVGRIRGNISAMAVHYPGECIHADLTETIDEFMNVGSLHMVHLSTKDSDLSTQRTYIQGSDLSTEDLNTKDLSTEDLSTVSNYNASSSGLGINARHEFDLIVSFTDYQHKLKLELAPDLIIGAKPAQPWSIFVTI